MQDAGTAMHRAASRFAVTAQEAGATGDLKPVFAGLAEVTAQCVGLSRGLPAKIEPPNAGVSFRAREAITLSPQRGSISMPHGLVQPTLRSALTHDCRKRERALGTCAAMCAPAMPSLTKLPPSFGLRTSGEIPKSRDISCTDKTTEQHDHQKDFDRSICHLDTFKKISEIERMRGSAWSDAKWRFLSQPAPPSQAGRRAAGKCDRTDRESFRHA